MSNGQILEVNEAADFLGYHPEHVRRLVRQGKLPARRIGKSYVFDAGELEAWQDRRDAGRNGEDAPGD